MNKTEYDEKFLEGLARKIDGRASKIEWLAFINAALLFLLLIGKGDKFGRIFSLRWLAILGLVSSAGYIIGRLVSDGNKLKSQMIMSQISSHKKLEEIRKELDKVSVQNYKGGTAS